MLQGVEGSIANRDLPAAQRPQFPSRYVDLADSIATEVILYDTRL
jgi:hypothetical protein